MLSRILRMLPIFPGKYRISKKLLKQSTLDQKNILINGKWGCSFLIPNLKENIGFEYFVNGVYEEETIKEIESLLPNNGVLLDIGANIGTIAIPICKRNPSITCFCIEASPFVFEYLQKNIEFNKLENIAAFNLAIHQENDQYLPFTTPKEKFGKGSYSTAFAGKTQDIRTITIDRLVNDLIKKRPDLIKVDVEGFEFLAFAGGKELLKKEDAPVIYFEFVDWAEIKNAKLLPGQAQQLLLDFGYQLFIVQDKKLIQIMIPLKEGSCNILAIKENNQNLLRSFFKLTS
ncbi:FkbM family methyltransferase [Flavihumibacter profundi]|uniref:FkbM family methyltransferase n=1 Tax=Flavihumibacter profundi TaxID=2716883 RepID=UPI001CC460AC|nr:FkbM family methyltransferase [Flavihumibacter profundi]MBZ5858003.1 FkbM family methyltransferase [Flavihumibacter profundi]